MPLNYSPALATAYATGTQVDKANLRGHLNQIKSFVDAIPTELVPFTNFASVAAFNAATIPSDVNMVTVVSAGGEMIGYRRQPGASGAEDLQHTNGSRWAKATFSEADYLAGITDAIAAAEFPFTATQPFTPTVTSQTAGLTLTGGSVAGRYYRINNRIEWSIRMEGRTATIGAGSGPILIGGFPLASHANSMDGGHVIRLGGIQSLLGGASPANIAFRNFPGGSYGHIYATYGNGTNRTLTVADLSTDAGAFLLHLTGSYEVAG